MSTTDRIWQNEQVVKTFLQGIRGAIPLAAEQLNTILKIIETAQPQVETFLDLGCGDGLLGRAILSKYPQAKGVLIDFSGPMLEAAQHSFNETPYNVELIAADFSNPSWVDSIEGKYPFDVIVSGFAIHHQNDVRKRELYAEIYDLLKPGGFFLNLEHVASASEWLEQVYDQVFIDALYQFEQSQGSTRSRPEIAEEYEQRPDKAANILTRVETQCEWLRKLGFLHVDCYLKFFEIALFGGMVPTDQ